MPTPTLITGREEPSGYTCPKSAGRLVQNFGLVIIWCFSGSVVNARGVTMFRDIGEAHRTGIKFGILSYRWSIHSSLNLLSYLPSFFPPILCFVLVSKMFFIIKCFFLILLLQNLLAAQDKISTSRCKMSDSLGIESKIPFQFYLSRFMPSEPSLSDSRAIYPMVFHSISPPNT